MIELKEYLHLDLYAAGQERLPFQRRVFMMLLFRTVGAWAPLRSLCAHFKGTYHDPYALTCFVVYALSLGVAGIAATLLYRAANPRGKYTLLVYPIFLAIFAETYLINNEAFGRYVYDLPALAFFSLGLYLVFTRRYAGLLAVVAIGTLNRETTMFLVPIFLLTAWLRQKEGVAFAERVKELPWLRFALLAALWVGEKIVLSHMFVHNNRTEDFIHLRANIRTFTPGRWPQTFSACAYLLPILWLLRKRVPNKPIVATIYIFPLWIVIMALYAVLFESRVFGELSAYCAVVCALLLDAHADSYATSSAS
jgi:hypothetical protein